MTSDEIKKCQTTWDGTGDFSLCHWVQKIAYQLAWVQEIAYQLAVMNEIQMRQPLKIDENGKISKAVQP